MRKTFKDSDIEKEFELELMKKAEAIFDDMQKKIHSILNEHSIEDAPIILIAISTITMSLLRSNTEIKSKLEKCPPTNLM